MIHVIADITLKPNQRDAFLTIFRQLVPQVLAEDGCLAYGPAVDVETGIEIQRPCSADSVTVIEQWASLDALRVHLTAPHMDEFRAQVADLVTDLTLRVCEPA